MGKLLLCSHSLASVPYYIENMALNIYSLEEMCCYLKQNIDLIEPSFMDGEPVWYKYMTCNACCKLSTYIGAGVPVIVSNSIPEADMIRRKELGLTVDSLAEAVKAIEEMTEERYDRMVRNTAEFGKLIRGGYFIRKALINAVFQLLYD